MARAYFLSLIFMLSGFTLLGQTILSGGWRTSDAHPFTRITAGNNVGPKVYRIECAALVDNSIMKYKIIVDGSAIMASLHEGSYVVVEGNNIAIQQLNQGATVKGTWTILQQAEIPATVIPWTYDTSSTDDLLIASFKVEQEFLLSINLISPSCSNTSFTVFIDGQAVKDASNKTLTLLGGSTISGKGKYITLRAQGTCAANSPIYGDFKIKKQDRISD